MNFSDLTEEDLRQLFDILHASHPDAVKSALDVLSRSKEEKQSSATDSVEDEISSHMEVIELSVSSPGIKKDKTNELNASATQNELDTGVQILNQSVPSAANEYTDSSSNITTGCYIIYDADSCKLMLQYSKKTVKGALGFYAPGPGYSIQEFKFKRNCGRVELIGNCASGVSGRKNYYSGWCQFIRAAKAVQGELWIYPRSEGTQGLDVDIYVFINSDAINTFLLPENHPCNVSGVEAAACLPKNAEFFTDVKVDLTRWMTEASTVGSATRFNDIATSSAPVNSPLFSKEVILPSTPQRRISKSNELKSPTLTSTPVIPQTPQTPCDGEDRKGCYLVYDGDSCKLMLYYSKVDVPGALGFYSPGPGHKIPEFKFKRNFGRAELIGNCASGVAGRKNYYSGWCQFVRAAKAVNGALFTYFRREGQQGLDVDIFVYSSTGDQQTLRLIENCVHNVSAVDAVACLPKNAEFFEGLSVDLNRWLTEASTVGAASRFEG